MNKNIKICFMGSPLFGRNVLEKLIEEFNVVLVVTQPDSYTNGGRKIIEQPVKILSKEKNIPVFQPTNIKDDYQELTKYDFDFIITAAYGQFIPKVVLNMPKIKVLNVHGSNLPKYRGGAPIQRAIMNGDEYLGVSIMETVVKMDAGDIYHKSLIKLEDDDNLDSMMDKLSKRGALDIIPVIESLYNDKNSIVPIKQEESEVTYSYNIKKEEEYLNFNYDATKLFNLIRALNSNPVAKLKYKDKEYKIYSSKVVECSNDDIIPGTIIDNKKALIIKCKTNALSILTIQPPSKTIMDIKSFLNGYRNSFNIDDKI